jgi:hypothetical protein
MTLHDQLIVDEGVSRGVPSYENWCSKMGYYKKSPIARIMYARCFQDVGTNDLDWVRVGSDVHEAIEQQLVGV